LRRLLVENAYGDAWRALGFHGEPKVRAVDLKQIIGSTPLSEVDMALAAGAVIGKISMVGLSMTRSKNVSNPSPPITADGFHGEREFTLSGYLGSNAGIVAGRSATRRDVIKYFANVKGGVHVGKTARKAEAKLVARMDKFEKRVRLCRKDGLLVELIAIGQALARSPDTTTFLEKAKQVT
jgi:hypothetical protein